MFLFLIGCSSKDGTTATTNGTTNGTTNYTITFNTNGGSSIANQTVPSGSLLTLPTNPTKEYNTFAGWYTDAGFTYQYTNTAVNANTTLYAKWNSTANVSIYAGSTSFGDQDGLLTTVQFKDPAGIALSRDGSTLYVADSGNDKIRKIDIASGTVSTFIEFTTALKEKLFPYNIGDVNPHMLTNLTTDNQGNVYAICINSFLAIIKITPSGDPSVIIARSRVPNPSTELECPATNCHPGAPQDLTVDNEGNIYWTDNGYTTIRKLTISTGIATILAGNKEKCNNCYGYVDGQGSVARFGYAIDGLCVDKQGNVYVADTINHCIRKITPSGMVSTLSGSPLSIGTKDGNIKEASFLYPCSIKIDINDNLYVKQSGAIRKIDMTTERVITIANVNGLSLTVDSQGRNMYVSNSSHYVKKITMQ